MKNFVQPGVNLTLVAPYALASGDGALVGLIFAVATQPAANGAQFEGVTEGVFDLTALNTDTAAAAGVAIYWDNTNKRCTTTASGNTKIGVTTQAKANGDTTVRVRLNAAF